MYSFVGVWSGDSKRGTFSCGLEDVKRECFTFNGILSLGVWLPCSKCSPQQPLSKEWRLTIISPFIAQGQCVINVIRLRLHATSIYKKMICRFLSSKRSTHHNFPEPKMKFSISKLLILANPQFKIRNIKFTIQYDKEKHKIGTFEKLKRAWHWNDSLTIRTAADEFSVNQLIS